MKTISDCFVEYSRCDILQMTSDRQVRLIDSKIAKHAWNLKNFIRLSSDNCICLLFEKSFFQIVNCNHRPECDIYVSTQVFGDPCPKSNATKSLKLNWTCSIGEYKVIS